VSLALFLSAKPLQRLQRCGCCSLSGDQCLRYSLFPSAKDVEFQAYLLIPSGFIVAKYSGAFLPLIKERRMVVTNTHQSTVLQVDVGSSYPCEAEFANGRIVHP